MVSSRNYRGRSGTLDRVVTRRWRTPGRRLRIKAWEAHLEILDEGIVIAPARVIKPEVPNLDWRFWRRARGGAPGYS
jgi:hypothetical protein